MRFRRPRRTFSSTLLAAAILAAGCGGDPAPLGGDPAPATGEAREPMRCGRDPEGCGKRRSRLDAAKRGAIEFWEQGAVVRWNEIARGLVASRAVPPPLAARAYALLGVAQYEALVAAADRGHCSSRSFDAPAVVAGASHEVLRALFPGDAELLGDRRAEHEATRRWAHAAGRGVIENSDALGAAIAAGVVASAEDDGSDAAWTGTIPVGPGLWTGANPLLPLWGNVRTWLVPDVPSLRPAPPPALGSAELSAAVAEVRAISDHRTAEQAAIAGFWADGAGTATPPGHWNAIAADLVLDAGLSEIEAARVFAALNMAEMDAGICCWDAKYAYWLLRPWMADPAITTPVGKPNFPSYTSGHSTFSGAAAALLAHVFPDRAAELEAMAEEASISRVYGGIHYRFDSERGLEAGRAIGALAIRWTEEHPLPH